METATKSKRRELFEKAGGFTPTTCTREEKEANRPDYLRFQQPHLYQTEEELKYFKSDENRELFREMYFNK